MSESAQRFSRQQARQQALPPLPEGLPKPPRTGKGGIPWILTYAMRQLHRYMKDPNGTFPELNGAIPNGSTRQQRSERSVACMLLLAVGLQYNDLHTRQIGIPQPDGSIGNLTVKFLAKRAGLGLRRAERAIHDLKAAGLVGIEKRNRALDEKTGKWRSVAAVKFVSDRVFEALGLKKRLEKERTKAHLRRMQAEDERIKAEFAATWSGRKKIAQAAVAQIKEILKAREAKAKKAPPRQQNRNSGHKAYTTPLPEPPS